MLETMTDNRAPTRAESEKISLTHRHRRRQRHFGRNRLRYAQWRDRQGQVPLLDSEHDGQYLPRGGGELGLRAYILKLVRAFVEAFQNKRGHGLCGREDCLRGEG
jgi:hypothetical protein